MQFFKWEGGSGKGAERENIGMERGLPHDHNNKTTVDLNEKIDLKPFLRRALRISP